MLFSGREPQGRACMRTVGGVCHRRGRVEMIGRVFTKRDERGFTLIELLIVIVILGILAAIVVFAVGTTSASSVQAACHADGKSLETALESYKAQTGAFPAAPGPPPAAGCRQRGPPHPAGRYDQVGTPRSPPPSPEAAVSARAPCARPARPIPGSRAGGRRSGPRGGEPSTARRRHREGGPGRPRRGAAPGSGPCP